MSNSEALPPEALALAEAHAARDRETLVRLIKEGKVLRDPDIGHGMENAPGFIREVEAMVRPKINLAIRSKKKRR